MADGPKAAGVILKAADTGRILMLQRGLDPTDPAAGMWEAPGGHIENGEHPHQAAMREFAEETGHQVPAGARLVDQWDSSNGVYRTHLMVTPSEQDVEINRQEGRVPNPDDPDGDKIETVAWWHPDQLRSNPAVRQEMRGTRWQRIEQAESKAFLTLDQARQMGQAYLEAHPEIAELAERYEQNRRKVQAVADHRIVATREALHYRTAFNHVERCPHCAHDENAYCTVLNTQVGPDMVCDAFLADPAKAEVKMGWTIPRRSQVKYSDDQPRDDHGRWGSGGTAVAERAHAEQIADWIARGQKVGVPAAKLASLVHEWGLGDKPVNLSQVHVTGIGAGHLFTEHARDLTREQMPVIPATPAGLADFSRAMNQAGITGHFAQVSPTSLMATQKELDGRKIGQMADRLERNGGKFADVGTIPALIVSRDGEILDGHHRWAACACYAIAHPGYKVPILRCDASIDQLLAVGHALNRTEGVAARAFGENFRTKAAFGEPSQGDPPFDPDGPWLWFDGRWVLIAVDDPEDRESRITTHESRPVIRESTIKARADTAKTPRKAPSDTTKPANEVAKRGNDTTKPHASRSQFREVTGAFGKEPKAPKTPLKNPEKDPLDPRPDGTPQIRGGWRVTHSGFTGQHPEAAPWVREGDGIFRFPDEHVEVQHLDTTWTEFKPKPDGKLHVTRRYVPPPPDPLEGATVGAAIKPKAKVRYEPGEIRYEGEYSDRAIQFAEAVMDEFHGREAKSEAPYYVRELPEPDADGKKFVVVNSSGKIKAKFPTHEAALAYQRALYANVTGAAGAAARQHGKPDPPAVTAVGRKPMPKPKKGIGWVEFKYSDDEERDDHGRWTTGGGTSGHTGLLGRTIDRIRGRGGAGHVDERGDLHLTRPLIGAESAMHLAGTHTGGPSGVFMTGREAEGAGGQVGPLVAASRTVYAADTGHGGTPRPGMGDIPLTPKMLADLRAPTKGGPSTASKYLDADGHFTPERQALHDQIVRDALKGWTDKDGAFHPSTPVDHPSYYMMGGGPASGKSSIIDTGKVSLPENRVHVDADQLKQKLPETQEMMKNGDNRWAQMAHEESSYLAGRIQAAAFERGHNVALDGTGDSSAEKLGGKIDAARNAGYRVVGHYVTVHPDEAVRRAGVRAAKSGREVPESVIRGTHASISRVLPEAANRFDELHLYDTNSTKPGEKPPEIAVKSGETDRFHALDRAAYDRFVSYGRE